MLVGRGYIAVPLVFSDFSIHGIVRCQATPQATPPFLGRCSMSFLEPPAVDFVLRPLRAFDLMEVPMLSNRMQALFRNQLFAPMVWPRQAFFWWSDLVEASPPMSLAVRLHRLHPPRSRRASLRVYAIVGLSDIFVPYKSNLEQESMGYDIIHTIHSTRFPIELEAELGSNGNVCEELLQDSNFTMNLLVQEYLDENLDLFNRSQAKNH